MELARVAIKYAKVNTNLMNIRTSSVRALGCFVRCLDGIYTDIPGMSANQEFIQVEYPERASRHTTKIFSPKVHVTSNMEEK